MASSGLAPHPSCIVAPELDAGLQGGHLLRAEKSMSYERSVLNPVSKPQAFFQFCFF